jgi:tRNA C32,U32 (ribose-2'-O)-methylase TrmJ
VPLERARIDQLVQRISDSLALLGFYKQPGREEQERFLRDIFARASLTEREAAYMGDLFSKTARLALQAAQNAALQADAIEPASHV